MYHEVITYMHFNNTHDRLRSPDFFFDHTSRYSIESKACHGLSNDIATTKRLYLHIQYTYIIYALKTSIQAVAAELENIRKKPLTRQADDRVGRFSFDKFQDVRAILLRNQLTPVLLLVGLLVRVPRAILLIFLVLLVLLGTGRRRRALLFLSLLLLSLIFLWLLGFFRRRHCWLRRRLRRTQCRLLSNSPFPPFLLPLRSFLSFFPRHLRAIAISLPYETL